MNPASLPTESTTPKATISNTNFRSLLKHNEATFIEHPHPIGKVILTRFLDGIEPLNDDGLAVIMFQCLKTQEGDVLAKLLEIKEVTRLNLEFRSCMESVQDHYIIDNKGIELLCEVLKVTPTVTELDLRDNHIDSEGARILSDYLQGARPLSRIDLRGNKICETGLNDLIKATQHYKNVQSLKLHGNALDEKAHGRALDILAKNQRGIDIDIQRSPQNSRRPVSRSGLQQTHVSNTS